MASWRYVTWWRATQSRFAAMPAQLAALSLAVMAGIVLASGALLYQGWAAADLAQQRSVWWQHAIVILLPAIALLALEMVLHFVLAREIYDRQQAQLASERAIAAAELIGAQYKLLAESSSDAIIHVDIDQTCRYASPAMKELVGWEIAELVGTRTRRLIHPEDAGRVAEEVDFLAARSGPILTSFRYRHKDGHYVWVESSMRVVELNGSAVSFVANIRDVTDRIETERRLAEAAAKMAELAATDQLTGLANRRRFNEELEREWRRAARDENPLSLLLLDVDHFKRYNDTYGHPSGDKVLKAVAETIEGVLHRPSDLAARWGGEEFVVLLPGAPLAGAIAVAERVRAAVEALQIPHSGSGAGCLTISLGIATAFPGRNLSIEPLVAEADANLYEAKNSGRNRVGAPPIEPALWVKA